MNKTLLIFRHEFLKTIKRTGFIILTLALPVLALLAIGIFHVASGVVKPPAEVTRIGFVDEVGGFNQFTTRGNIDLVPYETPELARQALVNGDVTDYFIIPQDFIATGIINLYTTKQQLEPPGATTAAITSFISSNLLAGKVPADVITRVETPLNLVMTTLTSTGEVAPQQASYIKFLVPGVFTLLLALSLIFTSTYVLQSLGEEKESRLMEILLSSVSTRQLLAGKVLGMGAIGLVQVIIWVISFPLLINLASSSIGSFLSIIQTPAYFWVLGVVYFMLGYSLFAVISAGIAAVSSSVQEAQSLAGLYTLFNVAPFWFVSLLLIFPNSPIWVVLTIFPLTAPVVTMLRVGLLGVPVWQLAISLIVLALAIVGGLLLSARLLRAYMLMYGKRPGLVAIIRNLRNA
jgi:ABC-2 type transport system permease protein